MTRQLLQQWWETIITTDFWNAGGSPSYDGWGSSHVMQNLCLCFHFKGSVIRFTSSSFLHRLETFHRSLSPGISSSLWGPPGSCTSALCVYANSIAIMCLLSLGCLGFCCQRLRQACGRKDPQCLYCRLCGLPPVSHHCFWRSPLTGNERFILSGLNYIVPPDC